MKRFGDFVAKQAMLLLNNKQQAIIAAVIFALLPFTAWLSVATIALVTLRKGREPGLGILLPAMVAQMTFLVLWAPFWPAVISAIASFVPCYLAACVLRQNANWQAVAGALFIQALGAVLLVQWLSPEMIIVQYKHFQQLFMQFNEITKLVTLKNQDLPSAMMLADLLFGVQVLTVVIGAVTSLMVARMMQARLFFPQGFKNEFLQFRCKRPAFAIFATLIVGTYYGVSVAINLLPLVAFYFLLGGFALFFAVFAHKKMLTTVVLLILSILIRPMPMLLVYIVFGALDSLFNFRSLLPIKKGEST